MCLKVLQRIEYYHGIINNWVCQEVGVNMEEIQRWSWRNGCRYSCKKLGLCFEGSDGNTDIFWADDCDTKIYVLEKLFSWAMVLSWGVWTISISKLVLSQTYYDWCYQQSKCQKALQVTLMHTEAWKPVDLENGMARDVSVETFSTTRN